MARLKHDLAKSRRGMLRDLVGVHIAGFMLVSANARLQRMLLGVLVDNNHQVRENNYCICTHGNVPSTAFD